MTREERRGEEAELGPLPAGHHGLSPEQVAESQRERLLAAVAHLSAERGYRATTITDIAKAASVANRIFYANFPDKEACFLTAFDAVADHLASLVGKAIEGADDWPGQVIAILRTSLRFFDEDVEIARFCLIAPLTATPEIAKHFRDTIARVLPLLAAGRGERSDGDTLPPSTEDSLLGGVVSQLSRSLIGGAEELSPLLPDLVEFVLAPYLGPEHARRLAAHAASNS